MEFLKGKRITLLPGAILASFLLAGCAIKPKALTSDELATFANHNLKDVTADQAPLGRVVTLREALARAIKYNLDYKVEQFDQALKLKDLNVFKSNMMPGILADAGYSGRSNVNAATSQSAQTGQLFLQSATSQDRNDLAGDLDFSWNVLDFGLSYVEAKQAANKAEIAAEEKRKVLARIVSDVRTAYWRALSAQHLVARLRSLEARINRSLHENREIVHDQDTSPVAALTNERELLEIQHQAEQIEGNLETAKAQLAALMNVAPNTKYRVAETRLPHLPRLFHANYQALVRVALTQRPEMREVQYKLRINAEEGQKALVKLLPGVQIFAGPSFDTNSFLLHSSWLGWGAKAAWNVVNIFKYPAAQDQIGAQDDVLHERALAVTMAVMTQVYVSRMEYDHFIHELATTTRFLEVQRQIVRQLRAQKAANLISDQTLIREQMNLLVAEAKRDIVLSSLQQAAGAIYQAVGIDPVPADLDTSLSIKDIAASLGQNGSWNALSQQQLHTASLAVSNG